ncbi:acyltransferase family protein [Actinoplanes sp. CA-030573]|uniref:acyltransferase family protein n=1 Tax=Actinoplanes sp. CA-030573 TaxID=3239898 RepID=UPI003D91E4AB
MVSTQLSGGDRRLPSLTGLRFIAAFAVFGFHISVIELFADPDGAPGVLDYLFRQGATGVSFFFVLSGFVLCWSARPGDSMRRFWRRRAAKVYPNHFVTALFALLLAVAAGAVSFWAVSTNFLLLQAWVPDEKVYYGLNTPSWSLSCEALFYLCFPLLLRAVDRLPRRGLWPATVATFAAVCAMPLVALALPDDLHYWFVYVFPPVRMLEFVAGILLARIVQKGLWIRWGVLPAATLAIAAYFASGYLPLGFSYVAGTVVPLALLIPAVATSDLHPGRSILRTRTMIWLGEISFAFYLVHQLAIRIVDRALGDREWSDPAGMALSVVMLAVALAGSWALYRIVEKPAMARFAGRRAASRPVAAQPAQAT